MKFSYRELKKGHYKFCKKNIYNKTTIKNNVLYIIWYISRYESQETKKIQVIREIKNC